MKPFLFILLLLLNCSAKNYKNQKPGVVVTKTGKSVIIISTGKASHLARKGSFYRQNISCNRAKELAYKKMKELYPDTSGIIMLFEQINVESFGQGNYCRMEFRMIKDS